MAPSTPTGTGTLETESRAAQPLLEAGVRSLAPHREHTVRRKGLASVRERRRTPEGVLAVRALRTDKEIEQNCIEGPTARDDPGHVPHLDADARIVHGIARQHGERSATPAHDGLVKFRYQHAGPGGKRVERRPQREAHAEASDEHPWRWPRRQSRQGQLGKRHLAAVRGTPHENTPIEGDQKVMRIALPQLEEPILRGLACQHQPGTRQCSAPLPIGLSLFRKRSRPLDEILALHHAAEALVAPRHCPFERWVVEALHHRLLRPAHGERRTLED